MPRVIDQFTWRGCAIYKTVTSPITGAKIPADRTLFDGAGNLVGVVSAKLDAVKMAMASGDLPQTINFAVKSAVVATFLDANRVAYKTGTPGAKAMDPADIADAARAMSGFVVCR